MKLLPCMILLVGIVCLTAGAQPVPLVWSQTVAVSQDTSFGSLRPRIAVADNGNVIVAWGKPDAVIGVYYAQRYLVRN